MNPKDFQNQEAGKIILTPTGFWAYLPNPLPPDISWSLPLISMLTEAERDLSKLAALVAGFPFSRLLIEPFIRNEAVISSRIEGTRTSLPELLNFEIAQLSIFEKTSDVREVFNYVRAMDYG
ncbi:Fic family protein, partial [bacterium]